MLLGYSYENFYNYIFKINIIEFPSYLEPFFLGTFSLIPGMIYFIIRFETSYFEQHNIYIDTINKKGTYGDIYLAKSNLIKTLKYEFSMFFRVVFIFGFILTLLGMRYIIWNGESDLNIYRYISISIAMCFIVLMYVVKVLFLYFDHKIFALLISGTFFVLNILCVYVFEVLGLNNLGLGILVASVLTLIIGILLFVSFIKNIDNYLFRIPKE